MRTELGLAILVVLAVDARAESSAPRDELAAQLADQRATIERTLTTISEKLATLDATHTRRVRAAYRLLHATPDDRMATARRRAAVRLVLARDASERALLADEATSLRAAHARLATDVARLATIALPEALARPARGSIARPFGAHPHERSKAMLSRRGIDLEVDTRAAALAPARGIVKYVGPIRGLEHGVILDHGDYLTVIAKLGEVGVPLGATVDAGDRLGRAARHRVYFEVRVEVGPGGMPIDPEPLLATSH